MNGNVTRLRVVLEPVEHRPAIDTGHVDVERDRVGTISVSQLKPDFAIVADDALETLVAREIQQNVREVGIVLDDEYDPIARLQVVAIVLEAVRPRKIFE